MLVDRNKHDLCYPTYSAAVCELSDACDMLFVLGFNESIVDCDSAMIARTDAICPVSMRQSFDNLGCISQ
jgi:hypothetical protein